ncbi:class I SAM-dependent methyltransferase [Kiritimatiellaeota bacterium B1221]|nr:class I SAM-dependent methyltransferase [Kiritimatiellaeota bacterium B1221]
MHKDYFEHIAGVYDGDAKRISNIDRIARAITENVEFDPEMHLMDFGAGTGLLLERIAPLVRKITAVDISKSMTAQLESKRELIECELEILQIDLVSSELSEKFDGVISSMTMHHVENIEAMFIKFYTQLREGGILAIADLDKEDGSFHRKDTGVYHQGFEREEMAQAAMQAGFRDVKVVDASVVEKEQGAYPVFLLAGRK